LEAFGRRPPNKRRRPSSGRHPKPFTKADAGDMAARTTPVLEALFKLQKK
jgi:hypothetical protein